MTPSEQHARKYDATYYQQLFGGAATLDPVYPYQVEIPSPEINLHLSTIQEIASNSTCILELGPFIGSGSTQAIRRGVEENISGDELWVTVDVVDHILPWLKPALPFWNFIIGDSASQQTADQARKILAGLCFDFIFIDTVHTKEHLAKELAVWSPLALPKCTWLFHDTWMLGQYNPMTDAIKEFAAQDGRWEYADISKECNGLGALLPC